MMKKVSAAVLASVMALSCLIAGGAVTAFASEEEQVLNVYRSNEPATLDRVASTIDEAGKFILFDASEPLFRIENGETVMSGAESYEYDEETLTYTITLKENYWQDGVQVTAQDYLYSFQRMVDPTNAYGYISDLYCIEHAEAIYAGEMEISELGVTAPDDLTLVIQLDEVNPSFLEVVPMYPQRQDFVEECGDSYGIDADKFLSCGPFILTAWEHNSSLTLVKNENYWDAENVALDQVNVAIISDSNALYASMLNGSLDYMETTTPEYIQTFEADENYVMTEVTTPTINFVLFNCEDELLSNVKIRQAISLAIDRETYVATIQGGLAIPAYGFLSSAIGIDGVSYRDVVEEPLLALKEEYPDPKALFIEGMQELGLGDDPSTITLTFSLGSTSASANNQMALFQSCLQDTLGVTVEPDQTEWATFWNDCKAGDFQIGSLAWSGEVDISFLFNLSLSDSAQMPCFCYTDAYDELVLAANVEMDPDTRFELYGEAEKLMLVDQCQVAPISYRVNYIVMPTYVKGWDYDVFSTAGHKGVSIEK